MDDLLNMAEEEGITVECTSLPLNKSMCVQDDEGDFILMDYSLVSNRKKARVHLAHEMGHSMTGSFYNPYAVCDIRKKHENRANRWAIEHLISREDLNAAIADGYTELWDLAEYFDVTEDFMKKVICLYKNGNLATECYC